MIRNEIKDKFGKEHIRKTRKILGTCPEFPAEVFPAVMCKTS